MAELAALVEKIRSKNAGPFWLTVDIFCGTAEAFEQVRQSLSTGRVAQVFAMAPDRINRYEIPDLNVIKFSLPRPEIQGSVADRDMHGASWACLLAELEVN